MPLTYLINFIHIKYFHFCQIFSFFNRPIQLFVSSQFLKQSFLFYCIENNIKKCSFFSKDLKSRIISPFLQKIGYKQNFLNHNSTISQNTHHDTSVENTNTIRATDKFLRNVKGVNIIQLFYYYKHVRNTLITKAMNYQIH